MAKTKVLSVTKRGICAESEARRKLEERIETYEDMGYKPVGGIDVSVTRIEYNHKLDETKCTMAQTMRNS